MMNRTINQQDERTLREFREAQKRSGNGLILESVRFYLAMPSAAAVLTAAVVITGANTPDPSEAGQQPGTRRDLRFHFIEKIAKDSDDRWVLHVIRWSFNASADDDVHEGRAYFEVIATAYGGSVEGCLLTYHDLAGQKVPQPSIEPVTVN
jgi:hypothetical protein